MDCARPRLPRNENGFTPCGMKYLFMGALLLSGVAFGAMCLAWDGFDADTTELVEITPDVVPQPGDTINVKNYDTDSTVIGIVESVSRNRRTIEVVARYPDGNSHTFVMEGR